MTIARDELDPTLGPTLTRGPDAGPRPVAPAAWLTAGALGVLAVAAGLLLPDVTGDPGGMTHYMGLLAANQPWNLLLFMAVPVILAETLAITELVILFARGTAPTWVHGLSRAAGLAAGPWFLGITTYLLTNAVVPLTVGSGWAGPADIVAVGAYLAGVVPLVGITLVELGLLGRGGDRARLRLHATFVGIFLVVAHVAMIFGMLDPTLLGWNPANSMHVGHGM